MQQLFIKDVSIAKYLRKTRHDLELLNTGYRGGESIPERMENVE